MSRIDEALKRASGELDKAADVRQDSSDGSTDQYPSEDPLSPDNGQRVVADHRTVEPPRFQFLRPLTLNDRQATRAQLDSNARLVSSKPNFVGVEQYRRLAAALHDAQVAHGLKVVTLTSALPRDGKTLTAVNLALTLSESYSRRVLLIDADLRRPAVHDLLGLTNHAGLNDVLQGDLRELPLNVVSPTLSVLTAGQAGSTPLAGLSSDRMRMLLDDCASRFDWVLLDVPPVGLLADAQILGRLTGAVILVIRAGSTPHAAVARAIAEIGRESIIGTVLNGVEERSVHGTHYKDYYDENA